MDALAQLANTCDGVKITIRPEDYDKVNSFVHSFVADNAAIYNAFKPLTQSEEGQAAKPISNFMSYYFLLMHAVQNIQSANKDLHLKDADNDTRQPVTCTLTRDQVRALGIDPQEALFTLITAIQEKTASHDESVQIAAKKLRDLLIPAHTESEKKLSDMETLSKYQKILESTKPLVAQQKYEEAAELRQQAWDLIGYDAESGHKPPHLGTLWYNQDILREVIHAANIPDYAPSNHHFAPAMHQLLALQSVKDRFIDDALMIDKHQKQLGR